MEEKDLPDFPDLPDLPDLPELPWERTDKCPVCAYFEEKVCRPHMTKGVPEQCGQDIMRTRAESMDQPREIRAERMLEVFRKYGIDPEKELG